MSASLFNPYLPAFVANPYPTYRRLQEEDPVHRSYLGVWVLTRYSDTVLALKDGERFSNAWKHPRQRLYEAEPQRESFEMWRKFLLYLEPPEHPRLRGLLGMAFTPERVERMGARVEQIVGELIDSVVATGQVDVVQQLAVPLPVRVVCELLGISVTDADRLKEWSLTIARTFDPVPDLETIRRGHEATQAFSEYLKAVLHEKQQAPADDLITALLGVGPDGAKLTEQELISSIIFFFLAGQETTANLIASGLLALVSHPEQLALLRARPELLPQAIEEMLRFDSPIQMVFRRATEDIDLRGRRIRAGEHVMLVLGAANRDPERFVDPDRFDLQRTTRGHAAFSHGAHFCIGAALARLEGKVLFRQVLERFEGLSCNFDTVQWREHWVMRGPSRFQLSFKATRAGVA